MGDYSLGEDSDVDEGGSSTHTQREVTASGIEKLRVGRQMVCFRLRTSIALLLGDAGIDAARTH